ncbi:MAG: flagellar motor switch protein FliM [Planctomycetota bacterium]
MTDMLDQSEVDALFASVDSTDEVADEPTSQIFSRRRIDLRGLEVRPYDFKRPERVSKDQMRALQTLHEAFARNFGASLSGFLRTIVEVKVASCEQMTYSEFIGGLPNPTSFNLIKSEGLDGQMCLEISPLIIYPIIDRLLGGTSQDLFIPQRPMTQIESRLISNVTSRGLAALAEAWEGIVPLAFEVAATESNPQLVQIVPPNEVVIVVGLEMKMSNRAGTMNLCIPFNVIEPLMGELAAQSWFAVTKADESGELGGRLKRNLSRAPIEVAAVLARTKMTVGELASLEVGDVVLTDRDAGKPCVLLVGGEAKRVGEIGTHRGLRAIRVTGPAGTGDR